MAHFAVTAIGADRPGIVAAVTEALRDAGGNLEDVSSTILRGHFTMMLVVNAPEDADATAIERGLVEATKPLGVTVTFRDVEAGTPERPAATHGLTVYGSDRPGIVAGMARLMSEREVNITDLSCRLTAGDRPVYAMSAELALPEGLDPDALARDIGATARDLGVDATFHEIESETL